MGVVPGSAPLPLHLGQASVARFRFPSRRQRRLLECDGQIVTQVCAPTAALAAPLRAAPRAKAAKELFKDVVDTAKAGKVSGKAARRTGDRNGHRLYACARRTAPVSFVDL
jgi:hypothetical protein